MEETPKIRGVGRITYDETAELLDQEIGSLVIKDGVKWCAISLHGLNNLESIEPLASLEEVEFGVGECPKLKKITLEPNDLFFEVKRDRCSIKMPSARLLATIKETVPPLLGC